MKKLLAIVLFLIACQQPKPVSPPVETGVCETPCEQLKNNLCDMFSKCVDPEVGKQCLAAWDPLDECKSADQNDVLTCAVDLENSTCEGAMPESCLNL